ncbi:hypothetical protein [Thalassorhabdomicrobium marinisediminis]|uniref:hypothetical protein n=1 Tax=Thalassorhabdomicrobium marinisediminis TaxID=2170577 RepID=UPI002492D035|nr:hypothetical protein [Thalassorhabdomicrobium marinisediminis]
MRGLFFGMLVSAGTALATGALAEIDGHGPDAWRVTGVAADDVLNMRMGPGTQYLVIDSLPPDARGLQQVTCVPLLIPSIYHRLSEAQRADLPQRWCLMQTADFAKAGWVAQRFLMEDVDLASTAPDTGAHAAVDGIGDAMIDGAARLVADLYTAFETQRSAAENPFSATAAPRYFFSGMEPALAGHGADVLYDAQDFQGRIVRIAPDADRPMLRGMITVNVDFVNFGQMQRAVFSLRADPNQPGAPVRIFRVDHSDWSFPE